MPINEDSDRDDVEAARREHDQSHQRFLDETAEQWKRMKGKLKVGAHAIGKVVRVKTFGCLIDLGEPFTGVLLAPNMIQKEDRQLHVSDYPKPGSRIDVTIIGFNESRRQLSLSLTRRNIDTESD